MAAFFAKKPQVRIADPFAVIPLKPDNVELRRDSRSFIHLRIRPELRGVRKWLNRRLKFDFDRRVELDEAGTRYYERVDGTHSLRDIVASLAELKKVEPAEMQRYVIAFTRTLMTMNLVVLKVPPEAQFIPDGDAIATPDGKAEAS
jgi:hypothetical protein